MRYLLLIFTILIFQAANAQLAGDGITDDTNELIKLLSPLNATVVIPKGTYRITHDIKKSGGSLNLKCEKGATIVIDGSYVQGSLKAIFNLANLDSAVIDGATIQGNRSMFSFIRNSQANAPFGIFIQNSKNVVVENCSLSNTPSTALEVYRCTHFQLTGNTISKPELHAIFVAQSSDGMINHNAITGLGMEVTTDVSRGGIGVLMQLSSMMSVEDNSILDMTDTGTKSEGCDSIAWRRNIVARFGKDGIKFQSYGHVRKDVSHNKHCIIEANKVTDMLVKRPDGTAAILVCAASDVTIKNNIISSRTRKNLNGTLKNDDIGIFLQMCETRSDNVTITGNTVSNTPQPVVIKNADHVNVLRNKISACDKPVINENSTNVRVD